WHYQGLRFTLETATLRLNNIESLSVKFGDLIKFPNLYNMRTFRIHGWSQEQQCITMDFHYSN
ncbi:hypothetical protein, partial [Pseudoalteromonas citrea]|uniref:hypothetical protein n=1 Tax=Pseudoalteromonas citrea TaxID=43655 RepID=UPI001BB14B5B